MLKSVNAKVSELLNGERFDIAAAQLFPHLSRKKIKIIIDSGGAYLNKKRIKIAKTEVNYTDKIELFWEEITPNKEQNVAVKQLKIKNNINISLSSQNIIFENEQFFIINKLAGIAFQSTFVSSTDMIFHLLNKMDPEKFNLKKMFLGHRLDKDTSGLMIIAKNSLVQKKFEDLFREKLVEKHYYAICFNIPKQSAGDISFPIAKDNSRKNCYFAITNPNSKNKNGKEALTKYTVVKYFKESNAALISCFPKTGRTHQIRVHLSALGCPLFGDKTYAQNIYGHKFYQLALRHMLHASYLKFQLDEQSYEFNSDLPEDFQHIIKTLEPVK